MKSFLMVLLSIFSIFSLSLANEKADEKMSIDQAPTDVDMTPFWRAWNLVTQVYINRNDVDKEKMIAGAIKGLMKSLDDPLCDFHANSRFENIVNFGKATAVSCQIINVKTINGRSLKIGYIKVNRFAGEIAENLMEAAKEFRLGGATKIILDLRFNGGGQVAIAVQVCSVFLGNGVPVYIKDDGDDRKVIYSSGDKIFENPPDLCLIGRATASASEIVASALKENVSCILVGDRTTGKGTIQSAVDVKIGRVYLTSDRFLTSKGLLVDKVGIEPDIKVKLSFEDLRDKRDPQLKKALEILREGKIR